MDDGDANYGLECLGFAKPATHSNLWDLLVPLHLEGVEYMGFASPVTYSIVCSRR